jgi:hypothetical protein
MLLSDNLLDYSVPFFNDSKKKIVLIVGCFPGIKCSNVYSIFKELSPRSISSQATYKFLKELVNDQIIVFDSNSKKYFLDDAWLSTSINVFQEFCDRKKEPKQIILLQKPL